MQYNIPKENYKELAGLECTKQGWSTLFVEFPGALHLTL